MRSCIFIIALMFMFAFVKISGGNLNNIPDDGFNSFIIVFFIMDFLDITAKFMRLK